MAFDNIIRFMGQQLQALKELEDLLAHNEKQTPDHSIKPEEIEALKTYVVTMKQAAVTAKALAEHSKDKAQSDNKEKPKQQRSSAKAPAEPKAAPGEEPATIEEFDFLG